MHVFISKQCQQEAKDYQVESKIQELAEWVRAGDWQKFCQLFERFQHPYYVRKNIGYRYRLLAKITHVPYRQEDYQVIVFFRVFHRGSDCYESLFHQADQHGDILYNQQRLDGEINKHLEMILTHQKIDKPPTVNKLNYGDSLTYFRQAKVNQLQLSEQKTSEDYYQEHSSWVFGMRSLLDDNQLQQAFKHVELGLETQQRQSFTIANTQSQFQLHPLLLSQENDISVDPFSRCLPVDVVLEKSKWLNHQQHSLPIYLNAFQKTVCDSIFLNNDSFPLLVNAPAGHGKTSLLAILAAHYILQPLGENTGVFPVLVLCESYEKQLLRKEILHYIRYQATINSAIRVDLDNISQYINCYCMDLMDLLHTLQPELNKTFDKDKFIDRYQFGQLWKKAPFIKKQRLNHIPIDLAWFVLQHLIKGETRFIEGKPFKDTLNSYSGLTCELYEQIYQEVWLEWYQPLVAEGFWDYQDLLNDINTNSDFLPRYASILVDNAENYSYLTYQVLLQCSAWWDEPELLTQAPIIFMGNAQAGTPHQLFDWQNELTTLMYRLYHSLADNDAFAVQRVDYTADFVSQAHYVLQSQRSKTNLIKFSDSVSSDTFLLDTEVFFVDTQDDNLTQALLLSANIPLIINSYAENNANLIRQSKHIGHWFEFAHASQITIASHNLTALPTKHHSVALSGFAHQDFNSFSDDKGLAFLSFESRYQLNSQLNVLRQAIQQGLKRVFILGDRDELPLWQSLFCTVCKEYAIRLATLDDFNPSFLQESQQLLQLEQKALASQDIEQIFAVALQYYQRLQYQKYFYLLLKSCELSHDYADYFDHLLTEKQKQLTFDYLWQNQQAQVILNYHDYMPESVKNNLIALQLIDGAKLDMPFDNAFVAATNQYAKQYKLPLYSEFWQSIFDQILARILTDNLTAKWLVITKQLYKLKDLGITVPNHILAMSYYRQQNLQKALALWQQVEHSKDQVPLPNDYYELCLNNAESWQEQTVILIKLKKLGKLMNLLIDHDLNELQLSYWEKILPYLLEEDELEPVLLALLPQVQDQDILDKIFQYCQYDTSENFMTRLQRLKTVRACLAGDWEVVIERLEHYLPVQDTDGMLNKLSQAFTTKKVMRGPNSVQKSVMRERLPKPQDEIVDILYSLNLNTELYMPMSAVDFEHYYQKPHIERIFSLIRQILSIQSKEDFSQIAWNIDFPAVRSLAYLLEKSNNIKDALSFYTNVINFSNTKKLTLFAVERLYFLLNRAKRLLADGFDISNFDYNGEDLISILAKLEKSFDKLLRSIKSANDEMVLPTLKSAEELIKSILALTDKEHREIQRLEQEQRQETKQKEDEEKRLALAAEHAKKKQAKLEKALLARRSEEVKAEKENRQTDQLKKEQQEQERQEQEKQKELEIQQVAFNQSSQTSPDPDRFEQIPNDMPKDQQEYQQHFEDNIIKASNSGINCDQLLTKDKEVDLNHSEVNTAIASSSSNVLAEKNKKLTYKATTEMHFFSWRIFISRMHQRINIEDCATGEHCSLYFTEQRLQSDWSYIQNNNNFEFSYLPLILSMSDKGILLKHTEHGVNLFIVI